jgi:hypothetical protein
MLKLHFLHEICHNCNMFRSILIIYRQLLRITKGYIHKHRITEYITFCAQKSAGIMRFVCSSAQLVHDMRRKHVVSFLLTNSRLVKSGDLGGRYICNWETDLFHRATVSTIATDFQSRRSLLPICPYNRRSNLAVKAHGRPHRPHQSCLLVQYVIARITQLSAPRINTCDVKLFK